MNAASQWRFAIAHQVAPIYADNPKVATVIVGGSTARGHSDRFSDIELGVFWHEPPTEDDRQNAADRINGDLLRLYPYDPAEEVWSDDFMIGRANPNQPQSGVLLEVVHYTTDFLGRTFDALLQQHNPDLLKQNFIAGIVDGLPLHNEALVHKWKDQVAVYPDELALAVVRRYAQIDHFWRWEMWLERGSNLMMLHHSFAETQQKLLHTLLALNRVYYFGFKWLDVVTARMAVKPSDLLFRLTQIYEVEPTIGAGMLAELVEETYDLIEQRLPEVDVDWLRAVFRYTRPLWDEPPL